MKHLLTVTALTLVLTTGLALARGHAGGHQNGGNSFHRFDSTIAVSPQNARFPSAVTRDIQLPTAAAAQGIQTANDARKDRKSFGAAKAAAAQSKEDGHPAGKDSSAAAKSDGRSFGEKTSAAAKSKKHGQSFGAANSDAARQLEDDARAAAQLNQEDFEHGSRADLSPPAVQSLPAVQGTPASPGQP